MTTKLNMPDLPRATMFDQLGIMNRVWQKFFHKLYERVGKENELSNTELADIINPDDLVPERILATNSEGNFESVEDLAEWISGTSKRIIVSNNGDGTITLSAPQDIDTDSVVVFGSIEATYHYIGGANKDGSWRFTKDGDDLKLQVRKAGTWTDTSSWLFADY